MSNTKKAALEQLFKKMVGVSCETWAVGQLGSHDIWGKGKITEAIPRHREINELLAKSLIKKHNLK